MLPERALQISTIVLYSVPWSPYCESNRKITAIVCMYLRAVPVSIRLRGVGLRNSTQNTVSRALSTTPLKPTHGLALLSCFGQSGTHPIPMSSDSNLFEPTYVRT
jgi:hypothetical protein